MQELITIPAEVRTNPNDQIAGFAKILADQIAEQLRIQGQHDQLPAAEPVITFGELCDRYYRLHALPRLRAPQNVRHFIDVHSPRWAEMPVDEILRREVQAWVDELGIRSKSAATKAVDIMSAIVNWGRLREHLPETLRNPCRGVQKFKGKPRERFLNAAEMEKFKESLGQETGILRDFFWICLLTGARKGNVQAMRWDEVDTTLGLWQFDSKNGDTLCIPLTSAAIEILERRRKESVSEWVFPGRRGVNHIVCTKRAWRRVLKRAGIQAGRGGITVHDLRRTLGSWLAMQGESQYVIGKILGHRDPRSTAIYARLDLVVPRRAMQKIEHKWKLPPELSGGSKPIAKPAAKIKPLPKLAEQTEAYVCNLSPAQIVCVEAKILTVLARGGQTKKAMYSKIGSCYEVRKDDLQYILDAMIERGLISKYQDERSGDWNTWRYKIA